MISKTADDLTRDGRAYIIGVLRVQAPEALERALEFARNEDTGIQIFLDE